MATLRGQGAGHPGRARPRPGEAGGTDRHSVHVLLVEDDDGDVLLVREWLTEVGEPFALDRARTVAEATGHTGPLDCLLVDLDLPDADGVTTVTRLRAAFPHVALVVLTGYSQARLAEAAAEAGAQDYLVKRGLTGELLARTMRYAIQRRRTETAESALVEERLSKQEADRLERGLLPTPLIRDTALRVTPRYRPGGRRMPLGGDFYDAVEDAAGALHVIIGDVAGHGPDQAAIGVALRIAWRTLMLAGRSDGQALPVLHEMLVGERNDAAVFATVAAVTIAPHRRAARLYLAGHPAPLLRAGDVYRQLPQRGGIALGLADGASWAPIDVALPEQEWEILMFTDGAVEGYTPGKRERLGVAGLAGLVGNLRQTDPRTVRDPVRLLDALVARITALNGGPLRDDLALVQIMVARPEPAPAAPRPRAGRSEPRRRWHNGGAR